MKSFKILKKGGILFFDDFLGTIIFDNKQVIDGVAFFLNKINPNSLKLIFINSQIAFFYRLLLTADQQFDQIIRLTFKNSL